MISSIENNIKSDWIEGEKARELCRKFLQSKGFPEDVVDALTIAAGELLENAIKYGSYRKKDDLISYSIFIREKNITIEVINPIAEEHIYHLKSLDKTIQWIRGYQNPFEAYINRLKKISVKSLDDKESGLGLFRIAYEGQSILDFFIKEDNRIAVSAVYQL